MLRTGLNLLAFNGLAPALPALLGVAQQQYLYATKQAPYAKDAAKPAGKKAATKSAADKRPPSGYTLFIKDRAAALTGQGRTATDMVKTLAAEWKGMTVAQKAPYQDEAAALKAKTMQVREAAKKPPSAYNLFFKEQFAQLGGGKPMTEAAKEIGAKWKALSEAEKQRYKDQAEPALAAHKASKAPKP